MEQEIITQSMLLEQSTNNSIIRSLGGYLHLYHVAETVMLIVMAGELAQIIMLNRMCFLTDHSTVDKNKHFYIQL
jgi:hypothetical protein